MNPPTNILVVRRTRSTWSSSRTPKNIIMTLVQPVRPFKGTIDWFMVEVCLCTCRNGFWVFEYPIGNDQCREHGKAKDKDVPGWIHIYVLGKSKNKTGEFVSRSNVVLLKVILKCRVCTCKLETPAAEMTPNITINMPPITGSGIVVKMATTFPIIPMTTIKTPLTTITIRLPTCKNKKKNLKVSYRGYSQVCGSETVTSGLTLSPL